MAPTGLYGPVVQARQFDEDGPTHLQLLGITVGGICVLLIIVLVCRNISKRLRARKYWAQNTASDVRAQATGRSPLQAAFPFNNKEGEAPAQSSTTVDTTAVTITEPSPVYDTLRAGRPPSYRTSILMWRETTARETAPDSSSRGP